MKAVGGAVEAGVSREGRIAQGGVEPRFVGALMQETATNDGVQKIRLGGNHGLAPFMSMQLPYVGKAHNAGCVPTAAPLTSRDGDGLLPS